MNAAELAHALGGAKVTRSKAIVRVMRGGLADAVKAMDLHLAGVLYHRGSELVHILRAREASMTADERAIRRKDEQPVIVAVSADALRVIAAEAAQFIGYDKSGNETAADCPLDYARALLALGSWNHIPPLTAIATSPTIRADGTIAQGPGYDRRSGLFLAIDDGWPPIPGRRPGPKRPPRSTLSSLRSRSFRFKTAPRAPPL